MICRIVVNPIYTLLSFMFLLFKVQELDYYLLMDNDTQQFNGVKPPQWFNSLASPERLRFEHYGIHQESQSAPGERAGC